MNKAEKHRRVKELARDLVRNSIIEDAIVQFVSQMVEYIHDNKIAELKDENERLLEAVEMVANAYTAEDYTERSFEYKLGEKCRIALQGTKPAAEPLDMTRPGDVKHVT